MGYSGEYQIPSYLPELDEIVGRINKHPEYNKKVRIVAENTLRKQAAVHSFLIEKHGEDKASLASPNVESLAPPISIQRMEDAWTVLDEYVERSNGHFSVPAIAALGRAVEEHNGNGLRTKDVRFGPFAAPASSQVPYLLENLVDTINDATVHPLDRAAEAHIELVRIHPFNDGNGRGARIVQNYLLFREDIPPILLRSSDRPVYISLLQPTLRDRYAGTSSITEPSTAERSFRAFLTSKAIESAQSLEHELQRSRHYDVKLRGVHNKGVPLKVADLLKRWGASQHDHALCARQATFGKESTLTVIGNISQKELEFQLDSYKGKFFKGYSVQPITTNGKK